MIALLAYRPVRLKNLAMMRLGRHLMKVERLLADPLRRRRDQIPHPLRGDVPVGARAQARTLSRRPSTGSDARRARTTAGPMSPPINPGLDAVWVSEIGTQLGKRALARGSSTTPRRLLAAACPRICFATAPRPRSPIDNRKHIGDASLVLGHAGHRTTEKHYNHARSLEASRRHAETLARLRES